MRILIWILIWILNILSVLALYLNIVVIFYSYDTFMPVFSNMSMKLLPILFLLVIIVAVILILTLSMPLSLYLYSLYLERRYLRRYSGNIQNKVKEVSKYYRYYLVLYILSSILAAFLFLMAGFLQFEIKHFFEAYKSLHLVVRPPYASVLFNGIFLIILSTLINIELRVINKEEKGK